MAQTTVVSTRIKKKVKEILEEAGVNIPKIIKEHLEELAWKFQLEKEIRALRDILDKVEPSERGFAVKTVREDRESH